MVEKRIVLDPCRFCGGKPPFVIMTTLSETPHISCGKCLAAVSRGQDATRLLALWGFTVEETDD